MSSSPSAGFVSGSVVNFNGTALPTTLVNAQLQGNLPAILIASPGVATITVVNPGGATSPPYGYTITSTPVISTAAAPSDNEYMDEREPIRLWVETWKEAGPELEAIRHREIRDADNLTVLALLEPAFNHAVRTLPPRKSSGMVEMQDLFRKLRQLNP